MSHSDSEDQKGRAQRTARGAFAMCLLFSCAAPRAHAAPAPAPAPSAAFGALRGVVREGNEPAVGASVEVVGTRLGGNAAADGSFVIRGVPAGPRFLKVHRTGHIPVLTRVVVREGENAFLELRLGPEDVHNIPTVKVTADRPVDKYRTDIHTNITRDRIDSTPVDGIIALIALTPGVVLEGDELHVQGGRGTELKFVVDGVTVADALSGGAPEISTMSVEAADVLTGGLNAEHGEALSGIVNLTTREGGDHFAGEFQWHTDRYGETTKTFNNFDRLSLGAGGPLCGADLTYFMALEGVFSDTYLKSGASRSRYQVLDFIRLGDRQSNNVQSNSKIAWRPHGGQKLTIEVLAHRELDTPYNHMWSR